MKKLMPCPPCLVLAAGVGDGPKDHAEQSGHGQMKAAHVHGATFWLQGLEVIQTFQNDEGIIKCTP
jgi:hypothetical protein